MPFFRMKSPEIHTMHVYRMILELLRGFA